jgi:hypothetical protein
VRKVEGNSTLEVFEGCRKECVQESFLRLGVIAKIRKDMPSILLKDNVGKLCLEGLQEASQVRTAGEQVVTEEFLVIHRNRRGGMDGRNSPRRIHEFP